LSEGRRPSDVTVSLHFGDAVLLTFRCRWSGAGPDMPSLRLSLSIFPLFLLSLPLAAQERELTLERAIELALTRNERAAIADARVDAAEARVRRARAFFFPELNLAANYTYRTASDRNASGGNTLANTATVTSTLFDARAFPLYRQARLSLEATQFQSEEDKRLLTFESADAYVTTLSFEAFALAARRRRDFARASFEDARARFEAGLVSSNDLTRAELELATADRELTIAQGNTQSALLQLENLLVADIEPPLRYVAAPNEAALLEADVRALIDRAVTNRLDLRARERQARALDQFASEPDKRFIPTLGLLGQYRKTEEDNANGGNDVGLLSVTMNWPVFDGGDRRAERAERLALAREAQLIFDSTRRRIGLEVSDAALAVAREQAATELASTAVRIATRNAEETQELYRQGLASALEVADSNLRLFEAEVAEVRARYQLSIAQLDLRAATGSSPLASASLKPAQTSEGVTQ